MILKNQEKVYNMPIRGALWIHAFFAGLDLKIPLAKQYNLLRKRGFSLS
jgi:hypothetical protein